MKENAVLDILMYLFKNNIHTNLSLSEKKDELTHTLKSAGFHRDSIQKAFIWLMELNNSKGKKPEFSASNEYTQRIYSQKECTLLNIECRTFLQRLLNEKILNLYSHELVIDRMTQIGCDIIDLNLLKWVILMVLFNNKSEEQSLAYMEWLVLEDACEGIQ